jgi:sortase A
MAFGPGHVAGSAAPGTPGDTVLSGHRDTQFRVLKDLLPGDQVRLETADGARYDYAVTDTQVVHARDLAILGDTGEPQLTLVTCFPFDAIAPGGPLRYVVRAARVRPALRARATGAARGPARVPSRLPRA